MEEGHKLSVSRHRELVKVKVLKDKAIVHYTEKVQEITTDKNGDLVKEDKFNEDHPVTLDFPPHEDFINAMKMLRKLAISICGFKGEFANFDLYTVLGLHFSGMDNDETAKVMITVSKKIERSGQTFTFNTPPTSLGDSEAFDDAEELDKLCSVVRDEAYAYLAGKHAAVKQLSLEFQDGENMKMDVQEK